MNTTRTLSCWLALALLLAPVPLWAGYRANQPTVAGDRDRDAEQIKRKQAAPNSEQVTAEFQAAYARAKKPRIAVFWNRALSDTAGAQWVANRRTVIQDDAHLQGTLQGTKNDAKHSRTVAISDQVRADGAEDKRRGPAELEMARFEEGMLAAFSEAGCLLVDRSLIMRMTAGDADSATAIETNALKSKTDLLLEVLLIRDAGAVYGFAFRVSVKNIKTGQILTSFVHQAGDQDENDGEWVAGEDGFEMKRDPSTFFHVQGQMAATKAMQALARKL